MKKIVCFVMCMSVFYGAYAEHWEIATSMPGEACYGMIDGPCGENTGDSGMDYETHAFDYYNIQCDMEDQYIIGPAKDFLKKQCGEYCSESAIEGTCEVDNLNKIFCVQGAKFENPYVEDFPCDFCSNSDVVSLDWSSENSNNAIVRKVVYLSNAPSGENGVCRQESVSENWGCPTGYYYVSGSGSSTVCAVCPSSAECTDYMGHRNGLRYKCKDGYFYNGTTCERCPSSGGVYGLTGKVGAQSRTECYIPSGGSFSDASGSGVFSEDCYYTE